jgi:hypothetical protein
MSIACESNEVQFEKLRERLRVMSDEELVKFGKTVCGLCHSRPVAGAIRGGARGVAAKASQTSVRLLSSSS